MVNAGRVLVVVRHGVTDANAQGVLQGQQDVPLNADGRAQAQAASTWLGRYPWSRVVSSDLARASATAHAIVGDAREVHADTRCREIDLGQWQGRCKAEVQATDPVAVEHRRGSLDARRGGCGETLREVRQRMRDCVDDHLTAVPPGGNLLMVTHGYATEALVSSLLGWEPDVVLKGLAPLDNCGIGVFQETPSGWRLHRWNVRADQDLGISQGIG